MSRDEVVIAVRVPRIIRDEFKKVSVEFGSYEKAINAFIRTFYEHPEVFPTKRPLPKPLTK